MGFVLSLALAGLVLATALPSHAQTAKPRKGLRVTYLLYSGRPNPTVVVTDSRQVAEIEKRLAGTLTAGGRKQLTTEQEGWRRFRDASELVLEGT